MKRLGTFEYTVEQLRDPSFLRKQLLARDQQLLQAERQNRRLVEILTNIQKELDSLKSMT